MKAVSYARALTVVTVTALILGAAAGLAGNDNIAPGGWRGTLGDAAGRAFTAIAGTVDGVAAARDARRAYRRDPSYAAPFPAPYYPYPNGYPYW